MSTAKRRLIPGGIELHPTECALVVHYSILEPDQQQPTPATKTIALKSLSSNTDLASLAADVAAKCKLVHPNKLPIVEQLLTQLVQRHAPPRNHPSSSSASSPLGSASTGTTMSSSSSSNRLSPRVAGANAARTASTLSVAESVFDGRWDMADDDEEEEEAEASLRTSSSPTPALPAATLDQLDSYLDLLYEDLPAKLESTRAMLSLALNPSNLVPLAANDSLLPALARTLREDTRRSMHLSATILAVFHQFARHGDVFHDVLKANKVGDLCLRQLELEVHRTRVLAADPNAKTAAASIRQRQDAVIYEAVSVLVQLADEGTKAVQAKMVKRGIVGVVVALLTTSNGDAGTADHDHDQDHDHEHKHEHKHEQRHPAVVLLLLQFLVSLTRFRESVAALLLLPTGAGVGTGVGASASASASASARGHDATTPTASSLIDMLIGYALPTAGLASGAVQAEALKLLLNLSHDAAWRAEMMRMNLVARLAGILNMKDDAPGVVSQQDEWVPELLLVMYQLSCDERSKAVFTYTDAMPIIRRMVLKTPLDQPPSVELMTLAINLAINEHNAEQFAEGGGLKALVKRLVRTRDYLVLKLVRNLSVHAALHLMFVDHLDDLVSTFLSSPPSPPDLLVELLGTLANLRHPSLNFAQLLQTYPSLLPLITSTLTALKPTDTLTLKAGPTMRGASSDDLALECIHLITTLALDTDTAPMLAGANVPGVLLGVMRAREDDDEMVLQVLLAFSHLLMLDATRDVLLPPLPVKDKNKDTDTDTDTNKVNSQGGGGGLVALLIDLMYDRNPAIRAACMRCLDVVCDLAEAEAELQEATGGGQQGMQDSSAEQEDTTTGSGSVRAWAEHIRTERFHFHNAEWLAAMAGAGIGAADSAGLVTGGSAPKGEAVVARWINDDDNDEDDEEELSIAIRQGKRSPKHLDHDDGGEHHAADMYGHVKLVYA